MLKTILILVLVSVSVLAACAPQNVATPDLNSIQTAVAQTLAAVTQTTEIPVTGGESPTPTVTSLATEASPTAMATTAAPTITQVASPISIFTPTPAVTPGTVQVYVSVPTNCRVGPGVSYTRVGGLQVGQVANVVGRNAAGTYWIILNPSRAGETCWLWGQHATVTGDTSNLPVFSPPVPATPVPGFDAALDGLESCTNTGNWWLDIAVENTGGITFRSFFVTVTDTVTGTELSLFRDNFIDRDGCTVEADQGDLDPEDTLVISSPSFTYDPSGHRIRTRITVCSNAGQSGTCLTQSFDFTP